MARTGMLSTAVLAMVGACGCAQIPSMPEAKKSPLHFAEQVLGTDSDNAMAYHTLVHYPTEHALRYPGLVIGVEKSSSKVLDEGRDQNVLRPLDPQSKSDKWLSQKLTSDSKVMFISHVVRTSGEGSSYGIRRPCFVYNAYDLTTPEGSWNRQALDSVRNCDASVESTGKPFSDSWQVVRQIRTTIQRELESSGSSYTHVIVVVMGWNTEQIESVQNFNSIVDRLVSERGGKEFRPYVIGVTWPSEWHSSLADFVAKAISLPNKANDADELGAGWLGAIIDYAVLPAAAGTVGKPKPVIVIGHSFGARATSHAVCRGTMLRNPFGDVPSAQARVDWLIGLEGAYSLNRFGPDGAGIYDLKYPEQCPRASHLLLTASKYDTAARVGGKILVEANFAGTQATFERVSEQGLNSNGLRFATYASRHGGDLEARCGKGNDSNSKLVYVDASETTIYNALGTGAGAHSDIYRSDTARVIWNVMNNRPRCEK